MTETTNDPKLLKTLVCLEKKQYDNMQPKQTEAIHKVQISILRRKNYRPHKVTNNRHHTTTQGQPCHKQDDNGGKTVPVAKTI